MNKSVKVVSFDVFDTLLARPVIDPTDLFHLMELRVRDYLGDPLFPFAESRRWAEVETRKLIRRVRPDYEDISLDEIYDFLQRELHLAEDQSAAIKQIELDCERRYLTPRKYIKPLYDLAVAHRKRIIVVSDVYLPQNFVAEVLYANGFDKIEKFYVSSTTRKLKATGGIFPVILTDLGIRPNEMVHIGDNKRADLDRPAKLGIKAFIQPKAKDLFLNKRVDTAPWLNAAWTKMDPSFRLHLGLAINDVFDVDKKEGWDPASLFNGDPYILGYYGVGPFILHLTKWVVESAIRDNVDELAFIARDSILIQKTYEHLRPLYPDAPPSRYLRISRAVCFPFDIRTPADLLFNHGMLGISGDLTIREVIEDRLGISVDPALNAELERREVRLDDPWSEGKELFQHLLEAGVDVLALFRNKADLAARYYRDQLGGRQHIGVFDIGYSARAQRVLSNLLDCPITGYYIASFNPVLELEQRGLKISNYLGAVQNRWVGELGFTTSLLELILSEHSSGTMIGLTHRGLGLEPVLESSVASVPLARIIDPIHAGALDFVLKAISTFGPDLTRMTVAPNTASHLLMTFMRTPSTRDALIFKDVEFSNDLAGGTHPLIGDNAEYSLWKEGYVALKRPEEVAAREAQERLTASAAAEHQSALAREAKYLAEREIQVRELEEARKSAEASKKAVDDLTRQLEAEVSKSAALTTRLVKQPPAPYSYGLLGWRHVYTPIIRAFVSIFGDRSDIRKFDDNPSLYFNKLSSSLARNIGALFYPIRRK